ncbi:PALP domain-containing protein [Mycena kentingensis (nom. inval.)]|nr:PALP domain-containing protein [Mycena kentingensis (nom. inval.)]
MPLFKSHPAPVEEPVHDPALERNPTQKHSLFSRRRSVSPVARTDASLDRADTTGTRRGFFGGRRNSVEADRQGNGTFGRAGSVTSSRRSNSFRSGTGFFGRNNNFKESLHKDPTIIAAREKVSIAEKAEEAADQALIQARTMVREAKDHVRFLEREAIEEAKRAKAKQAVANDISKSAGGLGRHG